MNPNTANNSQNDNPYLPTFEELVQTESLEAFRFLYKDKYFKDFLSDEDLIRQITKDWATAAEKIFFSTNPDAKLKDTELFTEVTVKGITYRLIGMMHDEPVDESVQVIRSQEKFLELKRTEQQNPRFKKGLAQADLTDIVAATEGCKFIYAEDNFDEYFARCGLGDISKKLISLNDHEVIFAALMPQIALSENPFFDGVFSRGLLSLFGSRKERSLNCLDLPELDIRKLIGHQGLSSIDPANITVVNPPTGPIHSTGIPENSAKLNILESPGIILLREVFGKEAKAEATHFLARLPAHLFYGLMVTKIPGLRCAPPFAISDEISRRNPVGHFSTTLRSALMALTLLKLKEDHLGVNRVGVLLGRGHSAEVAFYLKNPPRDEALDKLAEICADNIRRNISTRAEARHKVHADSRISRYKRYAAGYLGSICVETFVTSWFAIWAARQALSDS